jgi:hypothetical protein
MRTNANKRLVFWSAASLLLLAASLGFGEVVLRVSGYKVWKYFTFDANEPIVYQFDPVLGWSNMEGRYTVPTGKPGGKEFTVSFLSNGARATEERKDMNDRRRKILIVGGSFAQGWGISDEDTFAWKLQQEFPSVNVLNYGTGGYGTYQSLLLLEKVLPVSGGVDIVLYGYTQWHEERNVATSDWLNALSRLSTRKNAYGMPYATINRYGVLCRNAPERYPSWPLREFLVTSTTAEKMYMKLKTLRRSSQQTMVTEKVLLEMDALSMKHGSAFTVLLLSCEENVKKHYTTFLHDNNMGVVDCVYPMTGKMVADDGRHPNERLNSLYSKRIAEALKCPNRKFISGK